MQPSTYSKYLLDTNRKACKKSVSTAVETELATQTIWHARVIYSLQDSVTESKHPVQGHSNARDISEAELCTNLYETYNSKSL